MSFFGSQAGWNVGRAAMSNFNPQSLNFGGSAPAMPSFSLEGPGLLDGTSTGVPDLTRTAIPAMNVSTGAPNLSSLTGWDKGRLAIGGLQTLGNLWMGVQANNMARKQFNFQRDFANANLAQSIKQYNTGLEDRLRSRAVTEGRDSGWADAEIARNRLSDTRVGSR